MGLNFNRYAQNGDGGYRQKKNTRNNRAPGERAASKGTNINTNNIYLTSHVAQQRREQTWAPATIEVAGESAAAKGAGEL